MNTKPIKEFETIVYERSQDLENLIIYFSVTRVLRSEYFETSGFFNNKRWIWHRNNVMLYKYKSNPSNIQKMNFKRSSEIFDQVLGIPNFLLHKTLGCYGAKQRLKFEDVFARIGGNDRWKCVSHGNYTSNDENGNRIVNSSWCRKIYFNDNKIWNKYLSNPQYLDISTFPNCSDRVKRIVKAFEDTCKSVYEFITKYDISTFEETLKDKKVNEQKVKYLLYIARTIKKEIET